MINLKEKQRKVNNALFGKPTPKSGHKAQQILAHHVKSIKNKRENNGESIQELASEYNVLKVSMAYFLHKNNIYTSLHKNIPESTFQKVIKSYDNCNTIRQISRKLQIPEHRVDKILYIRFHHNKPTKKHTKPTALDRRKAEFKGNLKYYYNNLYVKKRYSIKKLADLTKTNRSFIRVTFVQNHLPRRTSIAPNEHQLKMRKQAKQHKSTPSLIELASNKIKNNKSKVTELQKRCTILSKVIIKQSKKLEKAHTQQEKLKTLLNQL